MIGKEKLFPLARGTSFTQAHEEELGTIYRDAGYEFLRVPSREIVIIQDPLDDGTLTQRVATYARFLQEGSSGDRSEDSLLEGMIYDLGRNLHEPVAGIIMLHQLPDKRYAMIEPAAMHRTFTYHAKGIPVAAVKYREGQEWKHFDYDTGEWDEVPHHRELDLMTEREWLGILRRDHNAEKHLVKFSEL